MLNKLLIIDDDLVTIKICELLVTNTQFAKEVTKLVNGKEGIDYFSNYFERKKKGETVEIPPDLILLDLYMPVMDGWEFLDNFIRKYGGRIGNTKIAILSSTINPQDFMKAQEYPEVIDFINKPLLAFTLEDLKQHNDLKKFFN